MKQYKWLSKRLISGVLVSVMLAATASVGLSTSPMVSASNPPPDTEWEKTFGGSDNEKAYSIEQTTDGGYIIAGSINSYGAGEFDVYLVKTDALGNIEWEKTYGGSGTEFARSVRQTTDGGYIIAGSTNSYGAGWTDFYLVKADALGNIEWEKKYGGSYNEEAYSIEQTTDGGYIIAGETNSYGAGESDVYLVKADALGNIEWEKTYGGSDYEEAYSIEQTTDGGYILAGGTNSYGVNGDAYLVKTDALGNKEWEKTYGGNNTEYIRSVEQTTDGGYILAGDSADFSIERYDIYLVKTDASGNIEWEKIIDSGSWDDGFSVEQTTDGGYILAGDTGSCDVNGDAYLVKTDALGNIEWEKTVGGSDYDCAYSIKQTTDGGYIIAGDTASYGAVGVDVYLAKVSPWTNTPVGSNVTVSLESAAVTFPDVQESGVTTATTSTENPGGPTPSDFHVVAGNFINITTTANYSGPVIVGIRYDESQVDNEESLRLFHWNGLEWEDITTSVDTVENIVYGQVASLSSFFLGEPAALPIADAGGPYLVKVGYSVDLDGSASYHPGGNIVSYDWSFGDNTTGSGVSVSHTYTAVGIYNVNLTITDDRGVQSSDTTMVVVYDPSGGFVTGGGWINSPAGAYTENPSLTEKATFGFVSKYQKGANVPTGQTEFQFKIANLNFHSDSYDWLVIAGARAQYKGTGTINGNGGYGFMLTAIDGQVIGNDLDKFRMKIWDKTTDSIIYDNQIGVEDNADPATAIAGGSIIIHNN